MNNHINTASLIAVMLLSAGYGWAGGHYIPADSNFTAYLFQFAVLSIIFWLGINYTRYTRGMTVFSIVSFAINILNIVHGAVSKDKNSFGSHNTFADLVPIFLILGGSGLWLMTVAFRKSKSQ